MTARHWTALGLALLVLASACSGADDGEAGSEGSTDGVTPTSLSRSPALGFDVCYEAPRDAGEGAISFSDATADHNLVDPLLGMHAHATAVGDVTGNGWTDLFVGTFADRPSAEYRVRGSDGPAPDRLLLGGPDGFSVDESFPATRGRTSGAAFADLDGDGDLDLVLARNPRDGRRAAAPSVVLRNDDGQFTEATVLDEERAARSIGVLDYDRDGRLDLFLVEDRWGGGSSVLLRNEGDLRFSDATGEAGLPRDVHGLGVGVGDLSGNGHPDLFVSGSNRLFVNEGDGAFREVDSPVPRWEHYGDEDDVGGIAAGDVTGDGRPDLVVGQHYNSTVDDGRRVSVRLYLNEGVEDGTPQFRDVTEEAGLVGLPTKAPHVELVDLDADGRPDIVTSASAADGTRPAVFRHLGTENGVPRFQAPDGLGSPQYWPTGAVFDADRDGRLDVFMAEWDPELPSPLFANGTQAGHWLGVQVGPAGSEGVGTVVEVFPAGSGGDGAQLLARREIGASTGYGAGALPAAYLGLGDTNAVDVVLHASEAGRTTVLRDVGADQLIQVGSDAVCGR